jgi:hypothetical protein
VALKRLGTGSCDDLPEIIKRFISIIRVQKRVRVKGLPTIKLENQRRVINITTLIIIIIIIIMFQPTRREVTRGWRKL